MTMNKKLELICKKLLQRIENKATDFYNVFYGCKTVEDVLSRLDTDDWGDVLYEVGYGINYCQTEVPNLSPRFCRLYDKVLARLEENEEKIMKMAKLYNE